ncbi:YdeI/OmpD-associated family protein [Hymenobacter terrenus]|uniref:YdeI/OmpD-associated family protein n=1 Tax=Hymenobacter terrenus TaxID=1629124 RepID=UPI0006192956|nr:YdeI/OmpD-associated family protein [Hymenobacter terrenus]
MKTSTFTFRAELVTDGDARMQTQVVPVPPDVVAELGGRPNQRVLATINGHCLRRGLLPRADGSRYLLLGKLACRTYGFRVGDELTIALTADPNPNQVDLPEELAEGLEAWPEAGAQFARLTPGRQRSIAYRIDSAKRPETRLQRTMQELEQLARDGQQPGIVE